MNQPRIERDSEGKITTVYMPYEWGFLKAEAHMILLGIQHYSLCPCDHEGKPTIKAVVQ